MTITRKLILTLALAAFSLSLALAAAAPLAAQPAGVEPARGADPYDWESWFALGDRMFRRQAQTIERVRQRLAALEQGG